MADGFGIAMAEVEFAGLKFKGGRIFVILTALTTLGGGLWGGFEFYKDYLTMKEQIQEYVAYYTNRSKYDYARNGNDYV